MSIVVEGADITYTNVTYGGNTGKLHAFTDPSNSTGTITVSGSLPSGLATAWIIGGGGGGGLGDSSSNGGGGGGGVVISGVDLSTLTFEEDAPYYITIGAGGSGGSVGYSNGTSGDNTYFSYAGVSPLFARGGAYGGGAENNGGSTTDGTLTNAGGVAPGGHGLAGSATFGGSGGAGGNSSSSNGGNGGSATTDGDSNGNLILGVSIGVFSGSSSPALPGEFDGVYTFGDGGASGQAVSQTTRYGCGGKGGSLNANGITGGDGALYIFVKNPDPPTDLEIGAVSNITSGGFTVAFTGGNGVGVTYDANVSSDRTTFSSPIPANSVNSGAKTATFSGLTAATRYAFLLTATNAGGTITLDPPAQVDINSQEFTTLSSVSAPDTPPSLTFVSKTSNSITVTGDSSGETQPVTSVKFYSQTGAGYDILSTDDYNEASGIYTITYSGLSPSTTYNLTWKLSNVAGDSEASAALSIETLSGGGNPPCFLRGSKILCLKDGKEEYIRIEDMRVGTQVKILNGTYVKVHTIGKTMFNNPDNADRGPNRLFRLTPSNYPGLTEDLIVTGCHSILVDKLESSQKARHLQLMKTLYMTTGKFRLMSFIDEKAEPYLSAGKHEIWHFALENENVVCNYGVYANGGLLMETASIKNMTERSGLALIE
jgi:hypothetical protein